MTYRIAGIDSFQASALTQNIKLVQSPVVLGKVMYLSNSADNFPAAVDKDCREYLCLSHEVDETEDDAEAE